MAGDSVVERSIWIAAPLEGVWAAISQPEKLARWFLPPSMGAAMTLNAQGTLFVTLGPMNIEMALLQDVDPPRTLTLRSSPDHLLTATYRVDADAGGTRVVVTVSGFDAFTGKARREQIEPTGAAWDKALGNLNAYVTGHRLPFPEGWAAALFGYRVESSANRMVERSIWIAAPRQQVWDALVEPQHMAQWFSPGTRWTRTELAVGGHFYVSGAPSREGDTRYIDVVEPPQRLVTHTEPIRRRPAYITNWSLRDEDGGTRMIIRYSGYERESEATRHDSMEQNAFGFGVMLQNLKAHIEGQPLPHPGGF